LHSGFILITKRHVAYSALLIFNFNSQNGIVSAVKHIMQALVYGAIITSIWLTNAVV